MPVPSMTKTVRNDDERPRCQVTRPDRTQRHEMRLTVDEARRWRGLTKQTGETLSAWLRRAAYAQEAVARGDVHMEAAAAWSGVAAAAGLGRNALTKAATKAGTQAAVEWARKVGGKKGGE